MKESKWKLTIIAVKNIANIWFVDESQNILLSGLNETEEKKWEIG